MTEVVVVGGGIVGSSAAYRFALAGYSVHLVDRDHLGVATAAGAGIVCPGTARSEPDPWYPLAFQAVAYYPELLASLADDGEEDTGYQIPGELVLALDESELPRLEDLRRLMIERRDAGVKNIGTVSLLSPPEVRSLFPPIHPEAHALHVAGSARVNGRAIRGSLQRALEKRGGKVIRDQAALACESGAVRGVVVAGQKIAADVVVVAAGAWTREALAPAGLNVPVYPQRGQILHLDMPGQTTDSWPTVTGFGSHYVLAFPGSRVVAGATWEDDAGFDYRITAAGAHQLITQATELAPGLANGTVAEIRVGFRPAICDGIPILGGIPGVDGLYVASGLDSSGLLMGPFAGALVADLAMARDAPLPVEPYAPGRFAVSERS